MTGSVEDWATESLLAAKEAYQDPATSKRIKPGTKLSDAYQEVNLPVVKRRLYEGGVRLSIVLNDVVHPRRLLPTIQSPCGVRRDDPIASLPGIFLNAPYG